MITIDLPEVFTEKFVSRIPSQRQHISKLLKQGIAVSYSLSFDRKKLWVVLAADSEAEVHTLINKFPIKNYIKYELCPLLFNETSLNTVPHLWLN